VFKKKQLQVDIKDQATWRDYQDKLKSRHSRTRRRPGAIVKFAIAASILAMAGYGILGGFGGAACHHQATHALNPTEGSDAKAPLSKPLGKKEVQSLLSRKSFLNLETNRFELNSDGHRYRVETSLDMPLQRYMRGKLDLATSRYIGIIAMEPRTGRVLAMVGYNKNDPDNNPCIDSRFPAASIFKIVTAAAAIEKHNFRPNSQLTYNGRKYTLYKSQLKEKKNKWTRKISLKDSFAQSINPVFGKIGALHVGRSGLEAYALAFGFNRVIDFEIALPASSIQISENPYQWAEIASGFNKKTKISPLHGALIASTVINQGKLIEPSIIDRIEDESGRVIYAGHPKAIHQTLQPEATGILNQLMAETIKTGTCKKIFRGYSRDKILSRLNIGGKTGSINNQTHDARFDWFVGFAEERKGAEKIVLAVLVAHEEFIGVRAGQYARLAMKHYFKSYFAEMESKNKEG